MIEQENKMRVIDFINEREFKIQNRNTAV